MTDTSDPQYRKKELLAELAAEVQMLRTSDGWNDWLEFAARFRTYSLRNQLLIRRQCPEASYVAGFRTWLELGRHVRKGERGIAILAPLLRRVADNESEENEVMRRLSGFRVVHVFDVSQTEGKDVPSRQGMPQVSAPDPTLLTALVAAAERSGYDVVFTDEDHDGARGWYTAPNSTITIVTRYSTSSQIRTLLHELGHACDDQLWAPGRERPEQELIAESSAYLVGTGRFGIDMTDASAFYVTSWGANLDRIVGMAEQVLKTADRIESLLVELPAVA